MNVSVEWNVVLYQSHFGRPIIERECQNVNECATTPWSPRKVINPHDFHIAIRHSIAIMPVQTLLNNLLYNCKSLKKTCCYMQKKYIIYRQFIIMKFKMMLNFLLHNPNTIQHDRWVKKNSRLSWMVEHLYNLVIR